jgi:CubicO group peptidase (beta-lactamase class C family)
MSLTGAPRNSAHLEDKKGDNLCALRAEQQLLLVACKRVGDKNVNNLLVSRRGVLAMGTSLAALSISPVAFGKSRKNATFDWTLYKPEHTGMSSVGLEGVRAAIQKHIDANDLTGAVTAIARHNKLVWFEAQGVRNPETGEPMRKDDIFRMASSSKPLTAVCILMLMEKGKR